MARTRRTRRSILSWFRFFPDDFLGGIATLSDTDSAHYLRLLCAQWASKAARSIPADDESLTLICRNKMPSARALEKFDAIVVDGVKCLRNQRLSDEWEDSQAEYLGRRRGFERGAKQHAQRHAEHTKSEPLTAGNAATQPQPQPHITTDSSTTARARESPGSRLDRAEAATKLAKRQKENELGALLARLAEHPNSRLMVPAWCKKVSAYRSKDGTKGNPGVSDYRMLGSIDRLEKSIEDARAWMKTLDQGKVVK